MDEQHSWLPQLQAAARDWSRPHPAPSQRHPQPSSLAQPGQALPPARLEMPCSGPLSFSCAKGTRAAPPATLTSFAPPPTATSSSSGCSSSMALTPPSAYARLPLALTMESAPSPSPSLPDPPPPLQPLFAASIKGNGSAPLARPRNAKGQSTGTGKQTTFIEKLFRVLQVPTLQKLMAWDAEGKAVVIFRPSELMAHFAKHEIFNQHKWASFTRQLNIYGFKKIHQSDRTVDASLRNLRLGRQGSIWQHDFLNQASTVDEIRTVKRKVTEPSDGIAVSPVAVTSADAVASSAADTGRSPDGFVSPLPESITWVPAVNAPSASCTRSTVPVKTVAPHSNVVWQASLFPTINLAHAPPLPPPALTTACSPARPDPTTRCPPFPSHMYDRLPSLAATSVPSVLPGPDIRQWHAHDVVARPPGPTPRFHDPSPHTVSAHAWACPDPLEGLVPQTALTLPQINPPPVNRPVAIRSAGGFVHSLCAHPPLSNGPAQGAWAQLSRPVTPVKSPVLSATASTSGEDEYDYPTPTRSPANSSFPLDDPSGWSTISEDDLQSSLFHITAHTSVSSTSAPPSVSGLPEPAGHAHPSAYFWPPTDGQKDASTGAQVYEEGTYIWGGH